MLKSNKKQNVLFSDDEMTRLANNELRRHGLLFEIMARLQDCDNEIYRAITEEQIESIKQIC